MLIGLGNRFLGRRKQSTYSLGSMSRELFSERFGVHIYLVRQGQINV